jgi:hypothetical protein
MDWFERLTGFPERDYATTKSLLDVAGHRLQSKVNGSSFATGTLETPSVKELRQRARGVSASLRGRVKVTCEPARDVEVTASPKPCPRVSQAFCSALPIGYWEDVHPAKAKAFATLVLDATYEATLLAAMLSAARSSSRTVFLTRVGGGVFQNDVAWIDAAMRRALNKFSDIAIDVRLVSFGDAPVEFVRLAQQYG